MAIDRRRLSGWTGLITGTLLVIIAWICFVLLAARPEFRFIADLTPNQTASISAKTSQLVGQLAAQQARVEIATFFERPPRFQNPTREQLAAVTLINKIHGLTVDLLRQYNALSGDRLQVFHIDPRTDPDRARKWRDQVGPVRGNDVVVVAVFRPKAGGGESVRSQELVVHSELAAIDYGNPSPRPGGQKMRPLPKLASYLGEEAITSSIKTMLSGGSPTLYLLDGHREKLADRAEPYDYTNLVAALQEGGFKVNTLNLGDQDIPANATVLASFEPKAEFKPAECEKLLKYLRRGGRLFINLSYTEIPSSWNVKLEGLLAPLGLRVGSELVGQFWDRATADQVVKLEIQRMNTRHKITQGLFAGKRSIALQEAVEVRKLEPSPLGVSADTTLLKTSDRCWLVGRDQNGRVDLRPPGDPAFYQSRSVAAIVSVDAKDANGSPKPHAGKLVLVTGAGLRNHLIGEGSQRDFGLNCLEWLAERRILVPISKEEMLVGNIDLGANEDDKKRRLDLILWTQVIIIPFLFLVLGVLVAWRRRRI
jgi:hypothetical protein